MAVEKDQSDWLPEPPPPRPNRRDSAIELALLKFDGVEGSSRAEKRAQRRSWVASHRPAVAVLVSAMLLVVIGIPAALIGIGGVQQAPVSSVHTERVTFTPRPAQPPANIAAAQPPIVAQPPIAAKPPSVAPAPPSPSKDASIAVKAREKDAPARVTPTTPALAPSMMSAAPPPPPPPAPPPTPSPAPVADEAARQTADNLAVMGFQKSADARVTEAKEDAAQPYAAFLSRLQVAVRANDRRSVMALIAFPLRVNKAGGSRLYSGPSALREYDKIFTPKVRQAILHGRADRIFVRDIGAMIGDGEVWFRRTCPNNACSPTGPVRIVAINP